METLSLSTLATQLVPLPDWEQHCDQLTARLARRFVHPNARQQASEYLRGRLSPVERKTAGNLPNISDTRPRTVCNIFWTERFGTLSLYTRR